MQTSVDFLPIGELTGTDAALWAGFQSADPGLASPYFSLGYVQAVEKARPGIHVLRFFQDGRPAAYWPLRRGSLRTARPVAGPMDDLHGIIAHPAVSLDLQHTSVRQHIGGYAFAATPFTQRRHGLHWQASDGNQVMDLSRGYEAWLQDRRDASSNFRREHNKVEALLGDDQVEVRHEVIDAPSFDRLITLKREAYARAGHFDVFSLPWPRALLQTLLESGDDTARGILSTLSIGEEVAAIAYCMRSQSVLHYWFPAYEAKFAKQKPGLALLFSLAQRASAQGLNELHLGLGNVQYKRQMASWMAPVRCGALALSAPQQFATGFTRWGHRIEGQNRLSDLPAKSARKLDRIALAGSWRA